MILFRKYIFFILTLTVIPVHARVIVDMAGRTLNIPENINRVLPYDAKTSILLYPIAQQKMTSRALLPGSNNLRFIDASYNNMPQTDIKHVEEVLMANPQIIIAAVYGNQATEKFNKLQKRINIPVVVVNISIEAMDNTYVFLGELLNEEAQATTLSSFISTVYTQADSLMQTKEKPSAKVYYTMGKSGLVTDPSGSFHTQLLDYLNITNVAEVPIPTGGHAKVNMEQVLVWNPSHIICAGGRGNTNAYELITSSAQWKSIGAVKNSKVFKIPFHPMGWMDHPPSVNRIPGIIWLCEMFYGLDKEVAKAQIISFYSTFYHYKINDEMYASLFE